VRYRSLEVEVGAAVYRLRAQADEDGRVHLQEMSAESMVQPYPARPSSGARSNRTRLARTAERHQPTSSHLALPTTEGG
jgi:hypothetical protein